MSKMRGNKSVEEPISKGKAIATSQRVGYLEPEECVLFCELAKKIKLRVDEQDAGDVRILRIREIKFYSDK